MRKTTIMFMLTTICLGIMGCTEDTGAVSKSPSPATNAPTTMATTNTNPAAPKPPTQETPTAPAEKP